MQRYEVEAIFEQKKDGLFEDINISSQKPIAIILGGQPACGKSTLINVAKKDHPNLDFLTVNGDLYRQFHPNKELIKDPIKYPIETQIFSSVFTEKLIEEAIKRKCNIIIEGTMRNPDVPLKTAQKFKDAGFTVEAYIIAAPKEFTQLGLYNRYQEEVLSKGQGRLADIDSHNKAINGLMKSANQLYSDKAVDKISIHTYLAKERIKDFNLVNGEWSCKSMPSIFIDESRAKQMKNKEILKTNIQTGKELIESVKYLSKTRTGALMVLEREEDVNTTSIFIRKSSKTRKRIKKRFFLIQIKKERTGFSNPPFLFIYLRLNSLSICCEICPLTVLITSLI